MFAVDDFTSPYHENLIVGFGHNSAIAALLPLLPNPNSPNSVPKVTHCVKALANECTATVGSFTTNALISFKKWLTIVFFFSSKTR